MWCGRRPSPLATTSARRLGTGDRSPPAPRQNEPGISPTDIELRTLSDQDRTVSAGVIHRLRYVAHRALWGNCAAADGRRSSDRKSTRLNSSHVKISYAVFCLKKKTTINSIMNYA